jgi:HAD superfamily 5'-nucleotidase-like hydrolase
MARGDDHNQQSTTSSATSGSSQNGGNSTPKLKRWHRIYVNRSLNMGSIKVIGFDMDHTLAPYNREAFESLAFRETLKKFIAAGYPEELLRLNFNQHFLIRGLLVDMDRGNVLKVDGHKYVKLAFHGQTRLDKETRHRLYNSASYKAGDFLSVDSFFALSEVQLYTEIIDYMGKNPGKIDKTYREVYQDLRRFIDLSHADGSIKKEVLKNPEKFIRRDKYLSRTLQQQIEAGKSLFLLTNSGWEYTNQIMNFLFDEPSEDFPSWRSYFDHVMVASGKPGFFVGHQPFYEVSTKTGQLTLHDDANGALLPDRIYQGGNARLFQKMTGYRGDEFLYVGDHLYGDIIRSKGAVNWRTLLIVEELDAELPKLEEQKEALQSIKEKLLLRETSDEELQILRSKINNNAKQAEKAKAQGESKKAHYLLKENDKLVTKSEELAVELDEQDQVIKTLIDQRQAAMHPIWGELMKTGLERSRFANQVAEYACLYTSRVSNMRFYSPFKRFSSTHDMLPHDL